MGMLARSGLKLVAFFEGKLRHKNWERKLRHERENWIPLMLLLRFVAGFS